MPVDEALLARNRLLAGVGAPLRGRLAELAEHRELRLQEALIEPDQVIEHVMFPLAGVSSLLSVMEDGRAVEVATVGNEGFVGLPVFLQAQLVSAQRSIVQVAGEGVALRAADFLELSNSGGPLQRVLQRYAQALIIQIAQGTACNRLHSVQQRCARWLLQTHDRVDGDTFTLTQEFLGRMLGVPRQAVNEAAQALQDSGCIGYSRGAMTVLDRAGLEAASCECYGLIRAEYDRLLPPA